MIAQMKIKQNNQKWSYIPDYLYRILIIGGSGSGKTNALLNLINKQPDIDKIYLFAKDPYEVKYQFLIKEKAWHQITLMILKLDVYKNIDEYNADKERQILIVFDDMIADMVNNKKLNPMVTDLFLRGRKLNISLFFVTQSYFSSKDLIKIYKKCAVEPYSFLLMMLRLHQIILPDLEKIFSTYKKNHGK